MLASRMQQWKCGVLSMEIKKGSTCTTFSTGTPFFCLRLGQDFTTYFTTFQGKDIQNYIMICEVIGRKN